MLLDENYQQDMKGFMGLRGWSDEIVHRHVALLVPQLAPQHALLAK